MSHIRYAGQVERTTVTKLFYGLFVDSGPLLLAAKTYAYQQRLNLIISQLSTNINNSTSVYYRVPSEIWNQIVDEVVQSKLHEFTVELIAKLSCQCCSEGGHFWHDEGCSSEGDDHMKLLPQTWKEFRFRSCDGCTDRCFGVFDRADDWLEGFGSSEMQLQKFLLSLNLRVIDPTRFECDLFRATGLAIGANIDLTSDYRQGFEGSAFSISIPALLDFDSTIVDRGFKKLQEEYVVEDISTTSYIQVSNDETRSSYSSPAWRVYSRPSRSS